MMSEKEYIQSGAIEAYVWGVATEEEQAIHQQMELAYAGVKEARLQFEREWEAASLQQATAVPFHLQASIKNTWREQAGIQSAPEEANKPASPVKPLLQPAPKPIRWFRTALAACALLLMGSILLNFVYWSKYTDYSKRYEALLGEQTNLLAKNNALQASLTMIKDPGMRPVVLQAVGGQPAMKATVYYGRQNNEVYLQINNLPRPAAGKQYQLWAEVDGVMVDAGLLTWNDEAMPVKMSTIKNAEAFAISLEEAGGSKEPTLSAVLVLGKV
jgi:hypothetical protein